MSGSASRGGGTTRQYDDGMLRHGAPAAVLLALSVTACSDASRAAPAGTPPAASVAAASAPSGTAARTEPAAATAPQAAAQRPGFMTMPLADVRTGERFALADFAGKQVIVQGMAVW